MQKKLLPIFLPAILSLVFANAVFAAGDLEVSTDSNFSNKTSSFSAGQTIYVRLNSDSSGDKKSQLNLRDNDYNLLTTYSLSKNGSTFSVSLSAPASEGYYSLEAQVESEGSSTTKVKTIKVGKPTNASVNVSVKQNVSGTTNSNSKSQVSSSVEDVKSDNDSQNQSIESTDTTVEAETESNSKEETFFEKVSSFFKKTWNLIWPF